MQKVLGGIILAIGIVVGANWLVLKLFSQRSKARAEHSFVGVVFLVLYILAFVYRTQNNWQIPLIFLSFSLVPCYLGTVFPDLDISLLGIGAHRNPLFHSSLSYFFLFAIAVLYGGWNVLPLRTMVIGYGIGLISHLWWDIVQYGPLRWLPGKRIDQCWLGIHGLFIWFSFWLFS